MAETLTAAVTQIPCEGCEDGTAVLFCCQCAHLICEECVKQHQRMKAFRSHRMITIAQLGEEHSRRPPPTCVKHVESPMMRFCRGCNVLLCNKCTGHESHEVKAVDQYASEVRREVEEAVKKVAERARELETAGSAVQATVAAVEQQRDSLSQTISESFEAAHHLLKEREKALTEEVAQIAERKTKALREQTEKLHKIFDSLNKVVSTTNQQTKKASNDSLVEMSKKTLQELEESLKECQQLHTMPDAVADINFSPPVIHVHQLGAVHCSSEPVLVTQVPTVAAAGESSEPVLVTQVPTVATVGESSEILLRIPGSGGDPSPGDTKVQLVSLAHPENVTNAEICLHSEENDVYRAVLVPQVRGWHALTITVNGKQIGEQSFNVFVNYHHTDVDKPLRTFAGLNGPCGMTLNPEGELIVAESTGNRLTVVNCKSWTRLKTITHKDMSNPTGVAVAKNGTIFVCQPHCLLLFNRNGSYSGTIGRQGQNPLEFNSPSSVKAIGDELYICDTDNGRVQVLSSNGQFLRAFFTKECDNPQHIAASEDGLYVVGHNSNFIWEYHRHGVLISKIQLTVPYTKNITEAHSLYVDCSGNIFVTIHSPQSYSSQSSYSYGVTNHSPQSYSSQSSYSNSVTVAGGVYVFRSTGEYITWFGSRMTSPSGMVIDEDGFVYVCGNGELCVF